MSRLQRFDLGALGLITTLPFGLRFNLFDPCYSMNWMFDALHRPVCQRPDSQGMALGSDMPGEVIRGVTFRGLQEATFFFLCCFLVIRGHTAVSRVPLHYQMVLSPKIMGLPITDQNRLTVSQSKPFLCILVTPGILLYC